MSTTLVDADTMETPRQFLGKRSTISPHNPAVMGVSCRKNCSLSIGEPKYFKILLQADSIGRKAAPGTQERGGADLRRTKRCVFLAIEDCATSDLTTCFHLNQLTRGQSREDLVAGDMTWPHCAAVLTKRNQSESHLSKIWRLCSPKRKLCTRFV